jgi:hypothetical protein
VRPDPRGARAPLRGDHRRGQCARLRSDLLGIARAQGSALVPGSETTKVLTHGKIPTLVCR